MTRISARLISLALGLAVGGLSWQPTTVMAQDQKPDSSAPAAEASAAQTAPWPTQVVRIVTAVAAGSQSDIIARAMSPELSKIWGRDVIIENRPGLAGTASVAKATADGHTLLLASNGHAMIPSLNRNINFDSVKDFAAITKIAALPGIMVVPPDTGPKTLQQLILNAKANPGRYNYASAGLGSASAIGIEVLKTAAGINLVHVPYKGLPDAQISVIRGDTILFMTFYSAAADLIASDKLRAIAIAGPQRLKVLPNVPTIVEAGVKDYVYEAWFGFLAPAGTPPAVIAKINADISSVAGGEEFRSRFEKLGVDIATTTPDAFGGLLRSDTDRFVKLFGRADEVKQQ